VFTLVKSSIATGLVWHTNMAAVTSCGNALLGRTKKEKITQNVSKNRKNSHEDQSKPTQEEPDDINVS